MTTAKLWEKPELTDINRMPPRSHFQTFFPGENRQPRHYQLLNGTWQFKFLDAPEYAPKILWPLILMIRIGIKSQCQVIGSCKVTVRCIIPTFGTTSQLTRHLSQAKIQLGCTAGPLQWMK